MVWVFSLQIMQSKILIIDDEVDLCLLIQSYLKMRGYEVCVAHTLSDGILKLIKEKPDTLLLDNKLPDGTGWSKVVEIQETFTGMNIILISAVKWGHEFYPTAKSPFRVMEKPIQMAELEKIL